MKLKQLMVCLCAALFAACLFAGAAAAAEWTPVTVTDTDGNLVTITEKPDKIISLAPVCTEIIYAVGAGDRLVGDTDYCNYPEAARYVEKVGGFSTISSEKVIALSGGNTVIFANPKNNGNGVIDYLKQQGCTVIAVDIRSVDDIYTALNLIGKAVGCAENAEKLAAETTAAVTALTDRIPDTAKKPSVAYIISTNPNYIAGKNTFQDELITLSGGVNAFSDVDGWGTVTLEKLLIEDPDIILLDSGMDSHSPASGVIEKFTSDSRIAGLSAVKNNQVYVVDTDIFDRGGPRVLEAVEILTRIIHPEIFGEQARETAAAQTPGFAAAGVLSGILCAAAAGRRK